MGKLLAVDDEKYELQVNLMCWSFSAAPPLTFVVCLTTAGLPPSQIETLLFDGWVGLIGMGITFLLRQRALALTAHAGRISQLIFPHSYRSFSSESFLRKPFPSERLLRCQSLSQL